MEQQQTVENCKTFVDILRLRAMTEADKLALIYLNESGEEIEKITYSNLDKKARAIAAHLQKHNPIGKRALLVYSPGMEFILLCHHKSKHP
jgi:acyl-CoA synthetase (AMP-forming)/AMP-acid ligase II